MHTTATERVAKSKLHVSYGGMPLERLDGLVSNVWLSYQEQNNQNHYGTTLQVCVIVSAALICVTRTIPSISHCQEPISRSLCLTYWGLESTFFHVDLFVERVSKYLFYNDSQMANQRRAVIINASSPTSLRSYMTEKEVQNNSVREKFDARN